jgi:GT2 family glycosyltransferase
VKVDVPGVVAALRAGLEAASGEIVAITDDDAAPWPDWIERLEAHYRAPSVGGVGGPDRLPDDRGRTFDPRTPVGRVRPYGRVVGNHHLGAGPPRAVDVLKGVNLSMRRHAVPESALDARLRGDGAQVHWELALCLALRGAGWTLVYDPAVGVDHFPARRFGVDQRERRPLRALADEVHNQTYALLRWLPPWQKPLALASGLLVGTRRAPGLLMFLERLPREADRRALGRRLRVALRARCAGLRTALRTR